MASLDDEIELITALPEVTEGARYGRPTWFVHDKGFAWERPFSLVQLDVVDPEVLEAAIIDAWLACAPEPLAHFYLSASGAD